MFRHEPKAHIVMNLEQIHFPVPGKAAKNSTGSFLCRERKRVEIVRKKVIAKKTRLARLLFEAGKHG